MRVYGLPVFGIIAATIAFYLWGFIYYGVLFSDAWMAAEGVSEADYEGQSSLWMIAGIFISLAAVKGMAFVLKWREWPGMGTAIFTALIMGLTFAVSVSAYELVYMPDHSWTAFIMDSVHLIIGWILAAIILTVMK
ncbi:MAG: DUF1761 domain-containing protein [bacterium]